MQGTVYHRNLIHRLGDAWNVVKGLPTPGQMFPPQQGIQTGYLTFPGWDYLERNTPSGAQDEARVKKAVQSSSVFANMRAIANEFSSSELIVKERKGAKLEDVENHPLEVLWEAPNEDMGRAFLMSFWALSYTMTGKAYLYWLPAGGAIQEVWPIPPFMLKPIPASADFIGGYAFRSRPDSDPVFIPRENITYSRSANIFDIRDGLSFLVAAMTPIESEIAMGYWNRNFFDEGNGIPDGMVALSRDALDVDVMRVRQEMRDFFGGTKRGLAIARENDLKYIPWGRSQKDAEFTEGIKLTSTQIGRTMGFPDGYWSESANRANAEQARATMIAGAVWPLLVALAEDMNAGVVRRFYGEQFRVEFKDIRPEDRALLLQELQFYAQIETVNELRQRIGADALDDPRGQMLVAEITKGAPLPATPAAQATEDYLTEQEAEAGVGTEEAPPPEEVAPPVDEGALTGGEVAPVPEEATMEEVPVKTYPIKFMGRDGKAEDAWEMQVLPAIADTDLARWERKALKSLKRFHTAAVRFDSVAIAPDEHARISDALKTATTAEDVRAAFSERSRARAALERAGLSIPQAPIDGQLTEAERAALADRIGDVGLSAAVLAERGTKAAPPAQDDTDALIDAEWGEALKWAKKVGA